MPSLFEALANHLWQSTLFAAVAGLLTLALRKNRAQVRYWLWLTASIKFLVPFSVLVQAGTYFAPQRPAAFAQSNLPAVIEQVSEPFVFSAAPNAMPGAQSSPVSLIHIALCVVWAAGFVTLACFWWLRWRRVQTALRAASPLDLNTGIRVLSSSEFSEPGVAGIFRPVLMVPAGFADCLTPPQLDAILNHELCHVRRLDNLTAVLHMAVEAVFWFYPLVWWLGARLMVERERACDEEVLRAGSEPQVYAEGILRICELYIESRLPFVAGVTGANLKKRIEAIMSNRIAFELNFAKKFALAAAGMAAIIVPVLFGVVHAPAAGAQSPVTAAQSSGGAIPTFVKASVTTCDAFRRDDHRRVPGTFHSGCTSVRRLIQQAYGLYAGGHEDLLSSVAVAGGPAWIDSERYQIDAEAGANQNQVMMNGPMLAALLEDKFQVKIHREAREVPVYALTAAAGSSKLEPFHGTCVAWDPANYYHPPAPEVRCGRGGFSSGGADLDAASIADLRLFLLVTLDRPVVDQTGLGGRFNFHLAMPAADLDELKRGARVVPALRDPEAPATDAALVAAIKGAVTNLGLNLAPTTGRGEFVVVDRVARPSQN